MTNNSQQIKEFEDDYVRNYNMTIEQKFNLQNSLYKLAHSIEKLTTDDSQQNLEVLIKTLKVFRDAGNPSFKGS